MNVEDEDKGTADSGADTPPRKRPDQKPAFRFEGVFETMALACGKASPTQGQCKFVKKHS